MEFTFDEYGIPSPAEPFWRNIVSHLFTELETDGWDQPHTLWTVLTPVATERTAPLAVHVLRQSVPEDSAVTSWLIALQRRADNGRLIVTDFTAPPDCAALILVTESWTSNRLVEDAGPTARAAIAALIAAQKTGIEPEFDNVDPKLAGFLRGDRKTWTADVEDRVETRNALVMQPNGTTWMFNHYRGNDPSDPETLMIVGNEADSLLSGVIPDLMRRAFGLPVSPTIPLGEVLGRILLTVTNQIVSQVNRVDSPTAMFAALEAAAILIDGLDNPYIADPNKPDMVEGFSMRTGELRQNLDEMVKHQVLGPLFLAGRSLARSGWEGFFDRLGAERWLSHDEYDQFLTPELRDWYGTGHLSRFLEERLPSWEQAHADLSRTVGTETVALVDEVLSALGWTYAPNAHL